MNEVKRKSAIRKFLVVGSYAIAMQTGLFSPPFAAAQQFGRSTGNSSVSDTLHFPQAQFQIPFNVESSGTRPSQVQLWVSTDGGTSWQLHGSASSEQRAFDFRAAAEGLYLFSVRTLDENGRAFPSPQPPMRVLIDTTKPYVELRADVNSQGQIVAEVRISEAHLKPDTVRLRYRTDQETEWNEVAIENLVAAGQIYEGQVKLNLKQCREVGLVVTVADEASNIGDATFLYTMPRTASANQDMVLASQRNGANANVGPGRSQPPQPYGVQGNTTNGGGISPPGIGLAPSQGAVTWPKNNVLGNPNNANGNGPLVAVTQLSAPQTNPAPAGREPQTGGWNVSGQLAKSATGINPELTQSAIVIAAEELPAPPEMSPPAGAVQGQQPSTSNPLPVSRSILGDAKSPLELTQEATPPAANAESLQASSPFGQAFHCNSRAFSLDYALNEVAGSALADVELWGTEDGGRIWQRWGSDPDRQSPFDVQVANDGLFGFRMVIVSQNGTVSNRPKDGDSADAWINVDTAQPAVKITRAVYGEGHEAGLLVLDYSCSDANLHERPLTLSYSETLSGPWVTITTGLKNSGIYLWKPPANLPEHVFLRLEAVDRAGNVGTHRLDLPINIQGLAPRGRIQGFRPINTP